jgi:hypothetical protein
VPDYHLSKWEQRIIQFFRENNNIPMSVPEMARAIAVQDGGKPQTLTVDRNVSRLILRDVLQERPPKPPRVRPVRYMLTTEHFSPI